MAADTNVGTATIGLDIEATGDLKAQIQSATAGISEQIKNSMQSIDFSAIADTISNSIKSSIEASMATLRETIQSTLNSALAGVSANVPVNYAPENEQVPSNNTANISTPRAPPSNNGASREAIAAQIDNLTQKLDITNAQIDRQREKLAALREQYNNTFNEARRSALEEQILRTEAAINRLTATSDRTGFRLADLDAQLAALDSAAQTAESGINQETESLARNTTEANRASEATNKVGNSLKQTNDRMRETTNRANEMSYGIAGVARQFFTWMIILPAAMSGLQALGSGLLADLKTNDQFNNSLAQIKTNLMVSFTPIFYAILPAINALMSALATATTYIASFISAIFGKTYQQSYQATQGLTDAKNAMGAYGDSTKKAAADAKNALAGFDEINKLTKPTTAADTTNDKVPVLVQPSIDTSGVDKAVSPIADKVKNILARIFEPFKQAWANEGQATIGSIQYALGGIWSLIGSIGKSFLEVWTNGTGTRLLTTMLQIFQNIFNLVGDIANTFSKAWNDNGIGTSVIQHIANALGNVLDILKSVGDSLRNVWGEVGPSVANTFMHVLDSIGIILENLTKNLKVVWDTGGQHLFEGLIKLGAKIFEIAGDFFNNFITPLTTGFNDKAAPAIGKVLDVVGSLCDYLSGDGSGITKAFLGIFAGFKTVEFVKAITAATVAIVTNTEAMITNTAAKVKDKIETAILIAMYVKDFVVSVAKGTAEIVKQIIQWAILTAAKVADKIATLAGVIADNAMTIAQTALNLVMAMNPITLIIIAIIAVIGVIVLLYNKCDWFRNMVNGIFEWLKNAFFAAIDFFKNNWQGILLFLVNPFAGGFKLLYDNCAGFRNFINGFVGAIANFFVWLWNSITSTFASVGNWFGNKFTEAADAIKSVFGNIGNFFGNIWNVIKQQFTNIGSTIGNAIGGAFKAVVNSVISFAQNAINGFIWAINGAIGLINKIPGVNIKTINQLEIPKLAQGGVLDQPTLAMVGEAGKEAVMPLENNTGWITDLADKVASRMPQGSNSSSSSDASGDIIFQIGSDIIGKAALDYINKLRRQNGQAIITI